MKIVNAKVFTPEFIFKDGEICVDKEQFAAVSPDVSKIDAKGLYAIPGLIDIHFHGAVGYDFMDGRDAVNVNEIGSAVKMPVHKLLSLLVDMEFKGLVQPLPGNRYKLVKKI